MNDAFIKYGVPSVVSTIAALCWFIMYLMKRQDKKDEIHRSERKEWQETVKDQFQQHNQLMKENTNVLSGLKTLLENKK